jgi:hypothetical protein
MIAQVDRDGNGKISIEGMLLNIHEVALFILRTLRIIFSFCFFRRICCTCRKRILIHITTEYEAVLLSVSFIVSFVDALVLTIISQKKTEQTKIRCCSFICCMYVHLYNFS